MVVVVVVVVIIVVVVVVVVVTVLVLVSLPHAFFRLASFNRFTPATSLSRSLIVTLRPSMLLRPCFYPLSPPYHCLPSTRVICLNPRDCLSSTSLFAPCLLPSTPAFSLFNRHPPRFHPLFLPCLLSLSSPPTNPHTPSAVVKRRFRADWSCALGMLRDNRNPSPLA